HQPARKIGAVAVKQVKSRVIRAVIQHRDQVLVLLLGRVEPECEDPPLIRHANRRRPSAPHQVAFENIRAQHPQVVLVIVLPQPQNGLAIHALGYVPQLFHRVEIRQQRHRYPVIPGNALVARNHHARFALGATAQLHRRCSADARKIDRCVARWIECAEKPIRLFHEQRRLSAGRHCIRQQRHNAQHKQSPTSKRQRHSSLPGGRWEVSLSFQYPPPRPAWAGGFPAPHHSPQHREPPFPFPPARTSLRFTSINTLMRRELLRSRETFRTMVWYRYLSGFFWGYTPSRKLR